jgi:hypothetical protein
LWCLVFFLFFLQNRYGQRGIALAHFDDNTDFPHLVNMDSVGGISSGGWGDEQVQQQQQQRHDRQEQRQAWLAG